MNTMQLTSDFSISRIVHGHWRLREWNLTSTELLALTQKSIEIGVTTIDHADIYGNYSCEKLFGDALSLKKELRHEIQLVTKCGIKLKSDKYPERTIKYYDYSYEYIIAQVENSLKNLQTDYIDLLLLHRPSPFFNPEEVAEAFAYLKHAGKVLHVGVSNFSSQQFDMLNSYLDNTLVTNQIEVSPYCLEHFENGNLDYLLKNRIHPMAWSPLAGGKLLNPDDPKSKRIVDAVTQVAAELHVDGIDTVIYSWILKHPTAIVPIVGSGKFERIKAAVDGLQVEMSLEQWFKIYIASTGNELP